MAGVCLELTPFLRGGEERQNMHHIFLDILRKLKKWFFRDEIFSNCQPNFLLDRLTMCLENVVGCCGLWCGSRKRQLHSCHECFLNVSSVKTSVKSLLLTTKQWYSSPGKKALSPSGNAPPSSSTCSLLFYP